VLSIKARRASMYIGGGALLVAWLAAANTAARRDPAPPAQSTPNAPAKIDAAVTLRDESSRLRDRLAQAPAPAADSRNLFSFAPIVSSRAASQSLTASTAPEPGPALPPPLTLTLIGIAEQPSPGGAARTAILTLRQAQGDAGADDIYMVTVGQTIAARYSVTAIGADAIELKDLATGGFRRLALK
jgi:hypothetical protein